MKPKNSDRAALIGEFIAVAKQFDPEALPWVYWLVLEAKKANIPRQTKEKALPRGLVSTPARRWWLVDFLSHPAVVATNLMLAIPAWQRAPELLLTGVLIGATIAPFVIGRRYRERVGG